MLNRLPIKTVDRFIIVELLMALAFMGALFFTLAFVLLLFDELGDILEQQLSFVTGIVYVLFCIPHEIAKASPIIVTLAVVIAIGRMVQRNEMLMLFVGGYRPFRLALPLVAVLVSLMIGLYFMNEYISGPLAARAEILLKINQEGESLDTMQGLWLHGEQGRIYRIDQYHPQNQAIAGLAIFEFRGGNETVSARLDAREALYDIEAGAWTLHDVNAHYIQDDGSIHREYFETHSYMIGRTPDDLVTFAQVSDDPEKMSRSDLARTVADIRSMGENPREYQIHLRIKEAFAFSILFLGLMSFGFILTSNLKSQASGIGLGLLASISYFLAIMFGKSIAMTGYIPPWLGAWGGNFICMALCGWLFVKMKREI